MAVVATYYGTPSYQAPRLIHDENGRRPVNEIRRRDNV